ncbi:MAG: hypothetical protein A3G34_04655 [Candidatus Lindowbacteria bacterium RIFCSPLOWO2_12_FULL_62_27]|nr:MAG: hypothetical protein A3I06_04420 [Candidatus Lindowbacteria bacterium RIFCSPLOWO2_02_FULL_62_12]OGH57449.1 MAG: hypothetical protein A3G34_04655 [Candidatus Lindowbacteria bacterium RIFCSPLOWO2_12_FULL_62_27]
MNKKEKFAKYDKDSIIIHKSFVDTDGVQKYEISHRMNYQIITQEEMNLLKTYPLDDYSSEELKMIFEVVSRTHRNRGFDLAGYHFKNAKDFGSYFDNLVPISNEKYGDIIFDSLDMESFFRNPLKNENVLQDIKLMNQKANYPSETIPGTSIEIINFSRCPKCATVYSLAQLNEYYSHPDIPPDVERQVVFRTDTRFKCKQCKVYFKPRLVVSDGTPKADMQFLCKLQTVHYIELFYQSQFKQRVLASNKENFVWHRDIQKYQLKIDVDFSDLSPKPALITNFIRHTPPNDVAKLLAKSVDDLSLFGELMDLTRKGLIYDRR